VLGRLQNYAAQVAERDRIAAELDEAKAQLATESALDLVRIEDATIKLRMAVEVAPLKIEAQARTVDGLKGRIAADKDILNSLAQLSQQNITSRRSYDEEQGLVVQEEAALAAALAQLDQLRRQTDLDQRENEIQIRLAKATLERAKAGIPVASLASQLVLAEQRVHDATITAPIGGTVLNVMAHPGELVGGDRPIVTMGDTSRMRAVAEVYETDIGRVRLGQSATVTSRVLDRPVTGKVVEIGRMIFKNDVLNVDPAARADARVVEVRIELDDPARVAALTNLTVDVRINPDEAPVAAVGRAEAATE
jgi:HlyD family secretion protein